MARKSTISKKESMAINESEIERQKEAQGYGKEVVLRDNTGGSISGRALTVKDKESFNKWLVNLQEKNPFIGKEYIQRATEYETDDKIVDDEVMDDVDDATIEALKSGAIDIEDLDLDTLDLDDMDLDALEGLEEALRQVDLENKFIDHCIVSNSTRKLLGRPPEEIKEIAESELCNYHQDAEYKTKINVIASIERAEIQLLLANEEKAKKVEQITQ